MTLVETQALLEAAIDRIRPAAWAAVDTEGDSAAAQAKVMVVTPSHRLEVRKIALGLETANFVEVLSGLKDGEMVVIGNRGSLQPGQEVIPKVTNMVALKEGK